MALPEKKLVLEKLCEGLKAEIAVLTRAAQNTRDAATHEEAKPENDKDTRSLEAAYLAGAQAERVRELEKLLVVLTKLDLKPLAEGAAIVSGALVRIESEDTSLCCLVAPSGGGLRAVVDGVEIQVVTPPSPLGRELLGKCEGEVASLSAKGRQREYEIVEIR